MAVFQGEVKSVAALLEAAKNAPEHMPEKGVGVHNTAAKNASAVQKLLAAGESLDECWRFGILQTLDDYTSMARRGGPTLAAGVFADEPARTGAPQIDAAFAALAEHLALRDGWKAPTWAHDPARVTAEWYPDVPTIFRADADQESPDSFRNRGILITSRSLLRA